MNDRLSYQDIQTVASKEGSDAPSGPAVDLFSYFGIICENRTWYATKYPVGIEYLDEEKKYQYFGGPEEFNGKKSQIIRLSCRPSE
ncbi:hypothetical protein GCK72_004832 [Caenorhabditis remanei]|uniref:Uncharacterized protein n=1 Tax=Caenorhabditis remanei TaxID=31234 RepID=A0A6A5HD89_CAERE|nr:hypothetical protein GCK72_004832 [Caenorhabditis remanei]KAF1764881.1 hypothetical protein GCK72_004832 [Caenorhabditis remanei]